MQQQTSPYLRMIMESNTWRRKVENSLRTLLLLRHPDGGLELLVPTTAELLNVAQVPGDNGLIGATLTAPQIHVFDYFAPLLSTRVVAT